MVFIGENFFPWDDQLCQQICLYYLASFDDQSQIPLEGSFRAQDEMLKKQIELVIYWIPLSKLKEIKLYPLNIKEDLLALPDQIKHFFIGSEV